MSAQDVVQAAVVAVLRAGIGDAAVFDAPPVRSGFPYVVVEEPVAVDWSTKDQAGRELRLSVAVQDAGERPVRLRDVMAAVEGAVLDLAGDLDEGWRVAGLVLMRSRVVRGAAERWAGVCEFRVRVLQAG